MPENFTRTLDGLHFVKAREFECEGECSEDMKTVFEICKDKRLNPSWISEESCLTLKPGKQDVFVFQEFKGEAFAHCRKFSCLILGPRALLTSLVNSEPVPKSSGPLMTSAMRGITVTTSFLDLELKKEVRNYVELMGGRYFSKLVSTGNVNDVFLVAGRVLSEKCEKAAMCGIKIMTCDWVKAVWEASQTEDVHAREERFACYKCPTFQGLTVTSSKFRPKEIKKIQSSIENNGGIYQSTLTANCNVLIVNRPVGDKFKFASQWELPCVNSEWVFDSIERGCALSVSEYIVKGGGCSTPTREQEFDGIPDMSAMSNICDARSHIDETLNSTSSSVLSFRPASVKKFSTPVKSAPKAAPAPERFKYLLKELDPQKTKKAGLFLDGCKVFLTGWDADEEKQLQRVLKSSGATRFTELSDSVTHVLVGELSPGFLRSFQGKAYRPHVVSLKWLVQCVADQQPADAEPFICIDLQKPELEAPSPLSKKGLALLVDSPEEEKEVTAIKPALPEPTPDVTSIYRQLSSNKSADLMPPPKIPEVQPMRPKVSEPRVSIAGSSVCERSVNVAADDSECTEATFFEGLKFMLIGLESSLSDTEEKIKLSGGSIVPKSFKGIPDYAVVPLTGASFHQTANEIVTTLWIDDCVQQQKIVQIQTFHQPVSVKSKDALNGVVIGITGHTGKDRTFIALLSEELGAISQEVFARKSKPDILASTHLICHPEEAIESSKMKAALKWKVPAVRFGWLLACAVAGSHVSEEPYLILPGQKFNATLSIPVPPNQDTEPSRQTPEVNKVVKESKMSPLLCPENKISPKYPSDFDTPERGLGLTKDPEESKYHLAKLKALPVYDRIETPPPRRQSTPLHVIQQRLRRKACRLAGGRNLDGDDDDQEVEKEQPSKRQRVEESNEEMNQENSRSTLNQSDASSPKHSFEKEDSSAHSALDGQLDVLDKLLVEPPVSKIGKTSSGNLMLNSALPSASKVELFHKKKLKEASQPYSIKWEDPVNMNRGSRGSDLGNELVPQTSPPPATSSSPQQENRVFMLSGVDAREELAKIITDLGGRVSASKFVDEDTTHLIVRMTGRSEKLLAGIGAGLWVLHPGYLFESKAQKKFVREEDFEWGVPQNISLWKTLSPNSTERSLALSAHRWRLIVNGDPTKRAFCKFKFGIHTTTPSKKEAYSRVIVAGGGDVVPENSCKDANVCLVDMNQGQATCDLTAHVNFNIPCVAAIFLCDYLSINPPPSPKDRLLPEYAVIVAKRSKSSKD